MLRGMFSFIARSKQHKVLLRLGLILVYRSKQNEFEFVKACKDGNVELVRQLLESASFQSIYTGIVEAYDNNRR